MARLVLAQACDLLRRTVGMIMNSNEKFGPPPPGKIKFFREPLSGHCHRVELFLSILGLTYQTVDLDVQAGEAASNSFRKLNPLLEVPVLWHGDRLLCDSNAILCYLALEFGEADWFPVDPLKASRIQRWLSVAAGELLNGPVTMRRIKLFGLSFDQDRALYESKRFLEFLDLELRGRQYLVGESPTIADIAIYTYTAHAPEGAISLRPYHEINRWLRSIEAWPAFVPMQRSATPDALI